MTRRAYVHRIGARAPDDVSGLQSAIDRGDIRPDCIVAIMGKTEGNGCVNDFSRGFATCAVKDCLARHLDDRAVEDVCLVMSGGTEGGLSPHLTVFEVRDSPDAAQAGALAIGRIQTTDLDFENLGRLGQVDLVSQAVVAAMEEAGIERPGDVHFVQIKCPLLTSERIAAVLSRGASVATRETLKSMALSRAASALGVAVALGEVERGMLDDAGIGRDWSLFSSRASASAGIELKGHEILVMGRSGNWTGPLRIDHAVMADAIDVAPVRAALRRLGVADERPRAGQDAAGLVALLAKAEASSDGLIRGYRHTMLDDSDIASTRHARGFVAGALAALVGHTQIYVSGGAEHQGPDGGGPVAVIAASAG